MMSVTKERFAQGLTYADYRAQMTRNQERLIANEQAVALDADDLAFFANLAQPLNVLALAEDWCGDVINNLPVLGRLAEVSGKINLRVFLRDQNLDIMDQYLKEGQFRSIPVFVFFDANFNELGYWIERPVRVTELQAEMRRTLFATDPILQTIAADTPMGQMPEAARDRLMQAYGAFRQENRAFSDAEVVRELRALVEYGTVQAAEAQAVTAAAPIALNGATPKRQSQVKVSITYCAACGYEPQTLDLTGALMRTFIHDLSTIELIPWHDGAFDVVINGDLIHSMYRDGGFPEHETVLNAVRERLVN
jgi:selT/selW/selH-like putative selenoprotein